jgi:hypothetical protein
MTKPEVSDDKLETGEGEPPFAEFLRRVRAGDEPAAVVRRYELRTAESPAAAEEAA